MSVVAFEGLFGGSFVQAGSVEDETDFIKRSCQGEVINFTQVQLERSALFLCTGSMLFVEQHFFVFGYIYKGSVAASNDSFGSFIAGLANHLDI